MTQKQEKVNEASSKFYNLCEMLYNKRETKNKNMKIQCKTKLSFSFIDTINSLSWMSAAISITVAGLSLLFGIGTCFILISA